jgi:hypothetical protein
LEITPFEDSSPTRRLTQSANPKKWRAGIFEWAMVSIRLPARDDANHNQIGLYESQCRVAATPRGLNQAVRNSKKIDARNSPQFQVQYYFASQNRSPTGE